jgi:hypothetical protein
VPDANNAAVTILSQLFKSICDGSDLIVIIEIDLAWIAVVADPVEPTASSQHVAEPMTNTVPVEPLLRVWSNSSTLNGAFVTAEPRVSAPD